MSGGDAATCHRTMNGSGANPIGAHVPHQHLWVHPSRLSLFAGRAASTACKPSVEFVPIVDDAANPRINRPIAAASQFVHRRDREAAIGCRLAYPHVSRCTLGLADAGRTTDIFSPNPVVMFGDARAGRGRVGEGSGCRSGGRLVVLGSSRCGFRSSAWHGLTPLVSGCPPYIRADPLVVGTKREKDS